MPMRCSRPAASPRRAFPGASSPGVATRATRPRPTSSARSPGSSRAESASASSLIGSALAAEARSGQGGPAVDGMRRDRRTWWRRRCTLAWPGGGVAQRLEHPPYTRFVGGSNPPSPTSAPDIRRPAGPTSVARSRRAPRGRATTCRASCRDGLRGRISVRGPTLGHRPCAAGDRPPGRRGPDRGRRDRRRLRDRRERHPPRLARACGGRRGCSLDGPVSTRLQARHRAHVADDTRARAALGRLGATGTPAPVPLPLPSEGLAVAGKPIATLGTSTRQRSPRGAGPSPTRE